MTSKKKIGSKIPTTQKNTNKKKASMDGKKFDAAFFKKNEFAVIILGALALTIIVFLIFFRSSGPKPEQMAAIKSNQASSFDTLEKRIKALETGLATQKTDARPDDKNATASVKDLDERITRLETAFLVKFESMIERMEKLEKNYISLKQKASSIAAAGTKKTPAALPAKKAVPKTAKKEKKKNIFHTVEKGETLYSISKKYNTSVSVLRKLNNLSAKDKIFPGNNIIVR